MCSYLGLLYNSDNSLNNVLVFLACFSFICYFKSKSSASGPGMLVCKMFSWLRVDIYGTA